MISNVFYSKVRMAVAAVLCAVSIVATPLMSFWGDAYKSGTFPEIDVTECEEGCVRVMSFNVRAYDVNKVPNELRNNLVADEILKILPDSLGVQELRVPGYLSLLARLSAFYSSVGADRDGNFISERSTIFYLKGKYKLVDSGTFWLSETPGEKSFGWDAACRRVCTWAILENKGNGERYAHVNTHFDHMGEEARANSPKLVSKLVKGKFKGLPVVFTADINATPDSNVYGAMTSFGLRDASLIAPDSLTYGTFHDGDAVNNTDETLDYILVNDKVSPLVFRTVTVGVYGRYVSDHFPIYADVKFN
ncbi:MAG: endonuclease/exonuclease/phosphatase family protein [Clostridia bacterium]|nr:endonuclease/exonuclease/phosphatase family protein [Clostridia bacterium]